MAANVHRVPKRQWRKWSIVSRGVFNRVYGRRRGFAILIPGDPKISSNAERGLAWNVAWIAADDAEDTLRAIAKGEA